MIRKVIDRQIDALTLKPRLGHDIAFEDLCIANTLHREWVREWDHHRMAKKKTHTACEYVVTRTQ